MKNLLILFILTLGVNFSLHSQVMRTFNYQGIVLDDEGQPLAGEEVSITVSIDEAGLNYTTTATTSSLGAFSVPIEISPDISFSSSVNYTIESSITTSAGTVSSTSPLSVVPMALFADKAAGIVGIDVIDESPENEIQTLSIEGSVLTISEGNSVNLPSSGGGGDGDNDPNNEIQTISVSKDGEEITLQLDPGDIISFDISDNDNSTQNEIQNLSIDNGNLILSNGGGQIAITNLGDGVEDDDADPENEIQNLSISNGNLVLSNGGGQVAITNLGDGVDDDDSDPGNEIQNLTLTGNTLSISGSNSVDLSGAGGDNDDNPSNELQDLSSSANDNERTIEISQGGESTTININDADADPENEIQEINLSGNSLSLTNGGGSVDLSNTGSESYWTEGVPLETIYNTQHWIGIGTEDPTQNLHVNGSARVADIYLGTSGTNSIYSQIGFPLDINGHSIGRNSDVELTNGILIGVAQGESDGMVKFENNDLYVYGDYGTFNVQESKNEEESRSSFGTWNKIHRTAEGPWYSDGTDIYHLGGGNFNYQVGIGTFNPESRFHVVGKSILNGEVEIGSFLGNQFNAINNYMTEFNGSLTSEFDALDALGSSTKRWTSLWATDGTINTSDRRFKKEISPLHNSLDKVLALKPSKYLWKDENSNSKKHFGFIAQELLEVMPEVVVTHEKIRSSESIDDFKMVPVKKLGVKYSDIIPVLTGAIQEQQIIIESQEERIASLEKEIAEIRALLKQ